MKKYSLVVQMGLLMLCVLCITSVSAAPVFKISKGDDVIYIGGTFHLLTEDDYPLPSAFEQAYEACDEIYFETDIGASEKPGFHRKVMDVLLYRNAETLRTSLNQTTYSRFVKYVESRQLDPMQFNSLNPTGVMMTLTVMEFQALGFVAQGVDKYYFGRASQDNKKIAWFESLDEQLALLDSFDNDNPNALINYTIDEMNDVKGTVKTLHNSWRTGDMVTLAKLGLEGFEGYSDIYDLMLTERNNAWMKKIEAMFGDEDGEFVLVGALHLPGKTGLLTQLAEKGYVVEKL